MTGFTYFMLAMNLLIPLTMILFGKIFIDNPPKNINHLFGYRTSMSMKNHETWEFAHKYCGKLWLKCGLILLPLSVIPIVFVSGKNIDTVGIAGGVVCCFQIIILMATLVPVEKALIKNFDKNGNRKKP